MRFLSIHKAEETNAPPTPEHTAGMEELIAETTKFRELLATEGCLSSAKGMRVRTVDGKVTVTEPAT